MNAVRTARKFAAWSSLTLEGVTGRLHLVVDGLPDGQPIQAVSPRSLRDELRPPGREEHPAGTAPARRLLQLTPASVVSHRTHVPTGRVALEAVLELLIRDFGVVPLRTDWEAPLTESRRRFEQWRTWS